MNKFRYIWTMCFALIVCLGFTACEDDDDCNSTPIKVTQIYLEDYESSIPDRPVEFARLGQTIRIEGSGFCGLKHVYINGYDTYFNLTYVTDNSMLLSLNSKTPITDAAEDVRNTIRFVKTGIEYTYDFTIRASSPSVLRINNTLPNAGEIIVVSGTNLHETNKVTLPGGIEVTDITSDKDGEWYSFVMPTGVTESGSILSEGAHGQASSPAYFNEKRGMILNFDGVGAQGFWSWKETGSMINDEDLVDDPSNSGRGKCVQIIPERLLNLGVNSGKARVSECWTGGADTDCNDWSLFYDFIPASTSVDGVAFQFDVYIPDAWSRTGHLQISLYNNFNFGGYGSDDDGKNNAVAFYCPWIVDGTIISVNTIGWLTVTIPFSEFNKYATLLADGDASAIFETVVADRAAATYQNFGIGFVNTDFTLDDLDITSSALTAESGPRIYLDNWRIVPCAKIAISDYPEKEPVE